MTPPPSLTRRDFFRSAALGAAACGSLGAAPAARPNIVLVLMDDLGFGQFGPNSGEFTLGELNPLAMGRNKGSIRPQDGAAMAKRAVPNLTRLAASGARFTDAYVACPLCAPSRSAIMTARYPQRFGVYVNDDINQEGVPADQYYLAKSLQQGGYATGVIGKWHQARKNGMEAGSGQHPLDRGFDYFFGFNAPGTSYYNSEILYRNREHAKAEGYTTEQFTEEAVQFIRRSKDRPFFLYLPYNAVHGPLGQAAPPRYQKRFDSGNRQADNFYAYLNAADEGIERVRSTIAEQGRENNTLFFLLSDNGAPGGSPVPSNGPFLGFKGQVWQGGVRIPMVMWGAGVAAGKVCREPVISMDILPTALTAAGISLPAGHTVDGRDLMPLVQGRSRSALHPALFWAGQLSSRWADKGADRTEPPGWAVRRGQWMLRYWSHLEGNQLYDLSVDKGERHDVAAAHPDVVRELLGEYAGWFQGVKKPLAWDVADWNKLRPKS